MPSPGRETSTKAVPISHETRQRLLFGVLSVVFAVGTYGLLAESGRWADAPWMPEGLAAAHRREALPSLPRLGRTLVWLVGPGASAGPVGPGATGEHSHGDGHLGFLIQRRITLQGALARTAARVLTGLAAGAPAGIALGLAMGWSRVVDAYVHPVFSLLRSIPPLALLTYLMLWLGHGEAHLVVPVGYAACVTLVVAAYHGLCDLPAVYILAARALGARGRLLWRRVLLPALGPSLLSGVRYALMLAWMTVVGAEMLMADDGIGHLIVGGGLWSSRLEIGADPAVVMIGIVGLAATGYAMDALSRTVAARLAPWAQR